MWNYSQTDWLMHYGRGHLDGGHSGRYPWGSGKKYLKSDGTLTRKGRKQYKKDRKKMRFRYFVFKMADNDVKNGIDIAERFGGKAGKISWQTSPQAVKGKLWYKIAEKRIKRTLSKMEKRYTIVYDPNEEQYGIAVNEPEIIENVVSD